MTFDEWYKSAKIFPPGTRVQMKMAFEAGRSDVQRVPLAYLVESELRGTFVTRYETEAYGKTGMFGGEKVTKLYAGTDEVHGE